MSLKFFNRVLMLVRGVLIAGAPFGWFVVTVQAAPVHPTTVDAGLVLTQDYFRNLDGGIAQGSGAPGIGHLTGSVSGQLWQGGGRDRVHVDLLGLSGSSISAQVGDFQGLDNIEAHNTLRIFEAWYQHDFETKNLWLRIGMQDYNAVFDTLDSAALFINSSFGLDPTISQTDVSTFPETSLGVVAGLHLAQHMYLKGGVYDAKPGRVGHPNGTHIEIRFGDGVFANVEAGFQNGGDKLGVGLWHGTSNYADPLGRRRYSNTGGYLIGERQLGALSGTMPVSVFVMLGLADSNRNMVDQYTGAGATIRGLLPGRPDDQAGLAVARARTSQAYQQVQGVNINAETAYELTYRAAVADGVNIQPDLQYIVSPGAINLPDAWVLGVRAEVAW